MDSFTKRFYENANKVNKKENKSLGRKEYPIYPVSKSKSKALSKAKGVITKNEAKGIKKSINNALKD